MAFLPQSLHVSVFSSSFGFIAARSEVIDSKASSSRLSNFSTAAEAARSSSRSRSNQIGFSAHKTIFSGLLFFLQHLVTSDNNFVGFFKRSLSCLKGFFEFCFACDYLFRLSFGFCLLCLSSQPFLLSWSLSLLRPCFLARVSSSSDLASSISSFSFIASL